MLRGLIYEDAGALVHGSDTEASLPPFRFYCCTLQLQILAVHTVCSKNLNLV